MAKFHPDPALYAFHSNWVDLAGGSRVHYLDQGRGPVLLFFAWKPLLVIPLQKHNPTTKQSVLLHCTGFSWFRATAGLGISALARRMLPLGSVEVGPRLGLPELPRLPILLHSRARAGRPQDALTALAAAFRSVVRD